MSRTPKNSSRHIKSQCKSSKSKLHLAACRYGNMKLTDQQRSVLSLSLITLISNASFSTIAPILPLECDAYQISEQWLSLIFLAYPVGFCVAAPLIAKWFEVVGTVQIMIWGMRSVGSIFLCMSFVFSFDAPSHLRIALLTMGQFSLGASMSTVSTGYYSLATLICSDQEKAMSYIESAVGLGYITGAILGSMMYEWLGYELAYRGVAFVMFVMSLGASNFLMKYLTCKRDKEIDFFDVEVPRDVVLASTNNTQVDGHIDDQQDSITQLSDKSTFCIEKDSNMLRIDQQEQIVCNKTILTTCSLLHHAKITSAGMSILWISASWSFLEPILAKRLLQFSLGKREIGVMFALSNIIYVPTAFFIQYIPKRYVQKHTIISISILLTPVGVLLIGTNSLSSMTMGILMLGFFPTPLWIFLLPSMQEDASDFFANQGQKRRVNDLTAGIYNMFITLGQIAGYIIGPLANQMYGATTTSQIVAAFVFLQFFVYCFGVGMCDRSSTTWRRKGRRRGRYFARYIV